MPTPNTRDPAASDRAGLGHQIKKHPFIALGLAIVASLAIGWALGSWSTCGPRCKFDADLFGALGAWVGGVGTIGAFAFTAHELISSRLREEKTDDLKAEEVLTKARQVQCYLRWGENSYGKNEIPLLLRVENYSSSPITNIQARTVNDREAIGHRDQLDPKGPEGPARFLFACSFQVDPSKLGLKYNPGEVQPGMSPPHASDHIHVEFTLEGHRFQWKSTTGEFALITKPHT